MDGVKVRHDEDGKDDKMMVLTSSTNSKVVNKQIGKGNDISNPTAMEMSGYDQIYTNMESNGMKENGFIVANNNAGEQKIEKSGDDLIGSVRQGPAALKLGRAGYDKIQYHVHGHGAVITADGSGGYTSGSASASAADYNAVATIQPSRVLGYDVQGNSSKIDFRDIAKADANPGQRIALSNPSSFAKQISFYRNGKPDIMTVDYNKFKATVNAVTNSN